MNNFHSFFEAFLMPAAKEIVLKSAFNIDILILKVKIEKFLLKNGGKLKIEIQQRRDTTSTT